jgi:8-oxo-dGTP pyrophosphatase MutT (NUDIX family)
MMHEQPPFSAWFRARLDALATHQPKQLRDEVVPAYFRRAAVLMPFWYDNGVKTLLTVRTEQVSSHKGQISFPGGRLDRDDEGAREAALRELHEECGIPAEAVQTLGCLDEAWSIGGYRVVPVVGWLDTPPLLTLSEAEIARVIVADVEQLMHPDARRPQEFERGGRRITMQAFDYEGDFVWGLTGGLLAALFRWAEEGVMELDAHGAEGLQGWLSMEQRP